jgi:hypothetical protein
MNISFHTHRRNAKPGGLAWAAAASAPLLAAAQDEPPRKRVEELMTGILSGDEAAGNAACEAAPQYGASAVRPLAIEMGRPDFEIARRAKRALYRVVRHAGRPGGGADAEAVQTKLIGVLHNSLPRPTPVRREILWMLSEIGNARAVSSIARLLTDKDLREDARCVLTRMPLPEALAALKRAFESAEEDFRYALADSLRARGEKVEGYPSRKTVPTGQTTVVPVEPKK